MANPNANTETLFYTAQYNGKLIKSDAAHDELEAIREIAEQLPELDIEIYDGDYHNVTQIECFCTIGGVEISTSNFFDHLISIMDWPEESIEISEVSTSKPVPFSRTNLKGLVSSSSIFNVQFIKRTTGEQRPMTCRRGATKGLKDGAKPFSDKPKDLLTAFDMKAKGYRSIPVDAIQRLSVNGQVFNFGEAA